MWRRLFREIGITLHWLTRDFLRYWRLDTPAGILGILVIISGLFLIILLSYGFARAFLSFIPWVSGTRIGEAYWASIGFGLKAALVFVLFCVSLISFIIIKFYNQR